LTLNELIRESLRLSAGRITLSDRKRTEILLRTLTAYLEKQSKKTKNMPPD
jgi:hypothetical protein